MPSCRDMNKAHPSSLGAGVGRVEGGEGLAVRQGYLAQVWMVSFRGSEKSFSTLSFVGTLIIYASYIYLTYSLPTLCPTLL